MEPAAIEAEVEEESDGGEVGLGAIEAEPDEELQEDQEPPAPPLLGPQERRVRGVAAGERGELAGRLDPQVPGPLLGPLPPDGSGWADIDRLGAWQCALNPFLTMSAVPEPLQTKWGRVVVAVVRSILNAQDETSLDRALKWFLVLPQAFFRQPKRGGQAGRSSVAGRFNAAMEGDWGGAWAAAKV